MASKACVVVGAGKGIGLSVAQRFAREGYAVGLIARNPDKLDDFVSSLELDAHKAAAAGADVSSPAQLKAAIRELERKLGFIEVLVYNAMHSAGGNPSDLSAADLQEGLEVNLFGALLAAQLVLPGMRTRGRGSVLFTGGGLALRPSPALATLSIGKAALRALVGTLASELAAEGIHVATVTVAGKVQRGTAFDPDLIAEKFWLLHSQERGKWLAEWVFDGK